MALAIVFFFVLMVAAAIDLTVITITKSTILHIAVIMITYIICMEIELAIIRYLLLRG